MAAQGRQGNRQDQQEVAESGGTLVFLKLGGSLITDKLREETARPEVIRRAAREIVAALTEQPDLRLVLGHGSGSFGHFAAQRHRLLSGPRPNWSGYAETGAAAARLNRLVVDLCLKEELPVVSLQPSASAICRDGELVSLALEPLVAVLQAGCIPVVFGDVAVDQIRGHTIISTEQIFAHLAARLRPDRIVLAGQVAGVFTGDPARDPTARRIPEITPSTLAEVEAQLGGSAGVDVTGGMLTKVREMLALVERLPGLEVWLVSGEEPGTITRALTGRPVEGTVLRA
jgi:isopentenyl phosphate kinase